MGKCYFYFLMSVRGCLLMRCLVDVLMSQMLQQLTKPHIDSFNYMWSAGLSDAVKVG